VHLVTCSGLISNVDLIIETARKRPQRPPTVVAVEVKRAKRWDRAGEKPMRGLAATAGVKVDLMIGVYCGERSYRFGDFKGRRFTFLAILV